MPDQVHQVGGVFAVVNGERRVKPYPFGIFPQKTRADRVEGAGPHERLAEGRRVGPHYLARDPRDPAGHLCSRSSREGHQQDAPGVGAVDDGVRNPVSQRVGLARASAGNNEKGRPYSAVMPHAMFNGTALLRIEFIKIGHSCQHESPRHRISDSGTKDNEQNRRRARRLVVGHLATSSSSA
jgi:hypothetical protein